MTRAFALVALVAGLWLGAESQAGPVRGPFGMYLRVEAGETRTLDRRSPVSERGGLLGDYAKFRGGRRASVIVVGDHDPVAPLVLEVFDEKGKLVARDNPAKGADSSKAKGNDLCGVVWYPPRDGYYTIKIKNLARDFNKCWIAFN